MRVSFIDAIQKIITQKVPDNKATGIPTLSNKNINAVFA